jgi:F-type H+-transporting ATPase subunit b
MTFNLNILDDSTLWVAVSFIVFIVLVYRPLKKIIIDSLDKKILELKSQLDESKKLKKEAEELLNEHILKDKENQKRIENLKTQTKTESLKIKEKIEDDLNFTLKRKKLNFQQLSSQMEKKIKQEIKNEIIKKTLLYTEFRIKKNIKNTHNLKLIDDSLTKLNNHL